MSIDKRTEALRVNIESLQSRVHELFEVSQRHDATISKVLAAAQQDSETITKLLATAQQDGENIRALARIAEIHERRLTTLEGGGQEQ